MGQVFSSLFGGAAQSVDIPETTPMPDSSEKEPVAQSVRDTERRRILARRGGNGTILSQPLGSTQNGNSILGKPM